MDNSNKKIRTPSPIQLGDGGSYIYIKHVCTPYMNFSMDFEISTYLEWGGAFDEKWNFLQVSTYSYISDNRSLMMGSRLKIHN